MSLFEFLAPIRRKKYTFLITFIALFGFSFTGLYLFPTIEKTTIYFSLKPLTSENDTYVLSNGIEEGSKVAETIAGWAKNPAFRESILNDAFQNSEVKISNFKRKLSAQKQNRLNVFWTLKLYGKETIYSERIRNALMNNLAKNFKDFNANNAFPFGYSQPGTFSEKLTFPISWKIAISFFFAFFFGFLGFFMVGAWKGKLLFSKTLKEQFPKAKVLKISDKIGQHDETLIKHFLSSFEAPKLISAFKSAEEFFPIETLDQINLKKETPIILVRLWDTKIEELENFEALFGTKMTLILFEQ